MYKNSKIIGRVPGSVEEGIVTMVGAVAGAIAGHLSGAQVFRFANQNESARAFTRTHTLKEAASTDHPLSPYVNSAFF